MNIALIAHDVKKELMVQFCIAYCGILSKHNLCATGGTGRLVHEATGLSIVCFLKGSEGGGEQIAARIGYNEIDVLLFFRDPLTPKLSEPKDYDILRMCDMNSIPFATNMATAEAIIHSIERGDFDYRNYTRPRQLGCL